MGDREKDLQERFSYFSLNAEDFLILLVMWVRPSILHAPAITKEIINVDVLVVITASEVWSMQLTRGKTSEMLSQETLLSASGKFNMLC